ncbi:MAG: hypothetical protein NUV81_04275 [bacterium]|nr:hypothetical protein [bacterium]
MRIEDKMLQFEIAFADLIMAMKAGKPFTSRIKGQLSLTIHPEVFLRLAEGASLDDPYVVVQLETGTGETENEPVDTEDKKPAPTKRRWNKTQTKSGDHETEIRLGMTTEKIRTMVGRRVMLEGRKSNRPSKAVAILLGCEAVLDRIYKERKNLQLRGELDVLTNVVLEIATDALAQHQDFDRCEKSAEDLASDLITRRWSWLEGDKKNAPPHICEEDKTLQPKWTTSRIIRYFNKIEKRGELEPKTEWLISLLTCEEVDRYTDEEINAILEVMEQAFGERLDILTGGAINPSYKRKIINGIFRPDVTEDDGGKEEEDLENPPDSEDDGPDGDDDPDGGEPAPLPEEVEESESASPDASEVIVSEDEVEDLDDEDEDNDRAARKSQDSERRQARRRKREGTVAA